MDTFCILLYKPNLSERKSDSETKSVSSVWPGRKSGVRTVSVLPHNVNGRLSC